jgi:PKHD-type hydroxylase
MTFVWPFHVDEINSFAYVENIFSKEECEKIISISNKSSFVKGGLSEKNKLDNSIRDSNIKWLEAEKDTEWIFRKTTDIVLELNEKFFKFNLFGFIEGFQFTNYKAPSGKYGKHVDRGFNSRVRKLSISIQLSDPKNYKGGELYLYESDKGTLMSKKQGTLVVFPSFILHEVTPVTKGERNSLVTWITGDNFK